MKKKIALALAGLMMLSTVAGCGDVYKRQELMSTARKSS